MRTRTIKPPANTESITPDLAPAYGLSLLAGLLLAIVSIADGLLGAGNWYANDMRAALSVRVSTGGILVPGFLAHDVLTVVIGLPILLGA
ncbi:MAG TPA: hypothetical protein VFX76_14810, partial [Roseiflexaceae bacterium]|nr:hypothetical protein [Roseiflexaceae bacterium]